MRLVPALRARRIDLNESLKDGQTTSGGGARQRFRNTLVVVEMALAVVLLVGAGLMLRSLWSLQQIRLGFDPANVLTMRLSLPQASYQKPEEVVLFYDRVLSSVRSLPGVQVAGAVRSLPLGSTIGDFGLRIEGFVPPPGTTTARPTTSGEATAPQAGAQASSPVGTCSTPQYSVRKSCFQRTRPDFTSRQWKIPPRPSM